MHYSKVRGPEQANFLDAGRNLCYYETVINKTLRVPHAARLIIGSDYRYLMPASGLLGIAVVTLSDTFARVVFAPVELPVGIIMAFIGAPFFLFLLRREI